ncbi:MAG: hypothetical protein J5I28_04655 [Acidimicrobiales bacterium]|jgi:hypothetical protein|nr:hypothetical protein [Acidimicrobiales bacterium]
MEPTTGTDFEHEVEAPESLDVGEAPGLGGKVTAAAGHADLIDLIRHGGIWVVIALVAAVLVILTINLWPRSNSNFAEAPAPVGTVPTTPAAAGDSLGIRLPDLTERWNEVTSPPAITKGIPRTPETGRFDAFTYRFNDSSVVAGAYDDRTEDIYALLVRSWLSDENSHRLVIHLCHVVHPHSPACLEKYQNEGLSGGVLEDFRDLGHRAEWSIDGVRWRLEIEENIQTIRAIAPGGP